MLKPTNVCNPYPENSLSTSLKYHTRFLLYTSCIWTVNLSMKSRICVFKFSSCNIRRFYMLKNMVKSIPFVSVSELHWKLILFLASDVFREWRSYCRDGEMFVKNAFLLCSPQKTTELCAELDNLGVQPWNIPAAAQIVWRTLLSPLWLWTSTRGAALVKQPSLLFWTLNTLGGPLSSSCVLKLWFSMIYKGRKKYGFWIYASPGPLNLSICSKECWVACPTTYLPPFFAHLLQHIFPVGYDRKHTWSQAT